MHVYIFIFNTGLLINCQYLTVVLRNLTAKTLMHRQQKLTLHI